MNKKSLFKKTAIALCGVALGAVALATNKPAHASTIDSATQAKIAQIIQNTPQDKINDLMKQYGNLTPQEAQKLLEQKSSKQDTVKKVPKQTAPFDPNGAELVLNKPVSNKYANKRTVVLTKKQLNKILRRKLIRMETRYTMHIYHNGAVLVKIYQSGALVASHIFPSVTALNMAIRKYLW